MLSDEQHLHQCSSFLRNGGSVTAECCQEVRTLNNGVKNTKDRQTTCVLEEGDILHLWNQIELPLWASRQMWSQRSIQDRPLHWMPAGISGLMSLSSEQLSITLKLMIFTIVLSLCCRVKVDKLTYMALRI